MVCVPNDEDAAGAAGVMPSFPSVGGSDIGTFEGAFMNVSGLNVLCPGVPNRLD